MKNLKKLFNFKTITSSLLAFVLALAILPLSTFLKPANATLLDTYPEDKRVNVAITNPSFETTTENITDIPGWTIAKEFDATSQEKDSTSINAILNTNLNNWTVTDETLNKLADKYIANWLALNPTFDFSANGYSSLDELKLALKANFKSQIMSNSPITHNYPSTTNNNVLFANAGNFYTSYSNGAMTTSPRSGHISFTSSKFNLEGYKYYKVSVWVKTDALAKANILLVSGDDKIEFSDITTSTTTANQTYYFYTLSSEGATDIIFASTTIPSTTNGDTIVYDGNTYTYNSVTSKYVYNDGSKDYFVTYNSQNTIVNNSDWWEYSFYVATQNKADFNLVLSLGNSTTKSSGYCFFDDIKITQVQYSTYALATEDAKNKKLDLRSSITTIEDFEDLDFASNSFKEVSGENYENKTSTLVDEETAVNTLTFVSPTHSTTNKALQMFNDTDTAMKLNSSNFEIKQFRYYRLSIWMKTVNSDANSKNAEVSLTLNGILGTKEVNKSQKASPYIANESSGATVASVNNYWTEYVFYIAGNSLSDHNAYLQINLTKKSTILVDNLTIELLSQEEYKNSTANTTGLYILDLNSNLPVKDTLNNSKDGAYLIENGYFNHYENTTDYTKPLPVSNWTIISNKTIVDYRYFSNVTSQEYSYVFENVNVTKLSETELQYNAETYALGTDGNYYFPNQASAQKMLSPVEVVYSYSYANGGYYNEVTKRTVSTNIISGIVPSNNNYDTYKDALGTKPASSSDINLLGIYSDEKCAFTYRSNPFTLTADRIGVLTANICTMGTSTAKIALYDKSGNLIASQENLSTDGKWKDYKFYVNVGTSSPTYYLEITLEGDSTGTARSVFFKNIMNRMVIKENSNTKEPSAYANLFNEYKVLSFAELKSKGLSLVDLSADNFIEHSNNVNSNGLYESLYYTANANSNGKYGILDYSTKASTNYNTQTQRDAKSSIYALIIDNAEGNSTTLVSKKSYALVKSSYYKISIWAKATNLTAGKYATINWSGIDTEIIVDSSEFVEYIVYVATNTNKDTEPVTIVNSFSLLESAGLFVIDSVSVTTTTKTVFEETRDDINRKSSVKIVDLTTASSSEGTTGETDENNKIDESQKPDTLQTFFLVLSSLLLVVAIVLVLITMRVKSNSKKNNNSSNKKPTRNNQRGFI